MIHEVDDDVSFRDASQRGFVLVIDADLVQQIQEQLRGVVPDFVVGEHVQIRHDLVHVARHATRHVALREAVFAGVRGRRIAHDRIGEQSRLGLAPLLQMVAGEPGAKLEDGALRGAPETVSCQVQDETAPRQKPQSGEGPLPGGHQAAGNCPSAFIR
jgi:hypothetical protein